MSKIQYYETGRRKTSIARVFLAPGEGSIKINNKELEKYFPQSRHQTYVKQPLLLTETLEKVSIYATVKGGGINGQAEAIRLGIARALIQFNPELKAKLKENNLLTRDPREVERKKYGRRKARARFQFSKR